MFPNHFDIENRLLFDDALAHEKEGCATALDLKPTISFNAGRVVTWVVVGVQGLVVVVLLAFQLSPLAQTSGQHKRVRPNILL